MPQDYSVSRTGEHQAHLARRKIGETTWLARFFVRFHSPD